MQGNVTRRVNKKALDHTMGLDVLMAGGGGGGAAAASAVVKKGKGKGPLFLVPDPEIQRGLHMINEPPPGRCVKVPPPPRYNCHLSIVVPPTI